MLHRIKRKPLLSEGPADFNIAKIDKGLFEPAYRDIGHNVDEDDEQRQFLETELEVSSTESSLGTYDADPEPIEASHEVFIEYVDSKSSSALEEVRPADNSQEVLNCVSVPCEHESRLRSAYGEVRHFAGGLVSHPYETTKHYSVLRHGIGLVYYRGPSTRIVITIFSDQALPTERTLWLQKRGFSGNMGMRLGAALGSKKAWIDVTPSVDALADRLPKDDERAWQRDIAKFLKKAAKSEKLCTHRPCETDVVRLPGTAEDGYFRVVVCVGDDVLCYSPVFRYASSSLDPSTLRGASLTTMPLELGIRITSFAIKTAAETAIGGIVEPALDAVHSVTEPYELYGLTQLAVESACTSSGAADKVDEKIQEISLGYETKYEMELTVARDSGVLMYNDVIGPDGGPVLPYPICFAASVAGKWKDDLLDTEFAAVRLVGVPEDILMRLFGTYISWVSLSDPGHWNGKDRSMVEQEVWCKAIVAVTLRTRSHESVVPRKEALLMMPCELAKTTPFGVDIKLMLMAFLGRDGFDVDHPVEDGVHQAERLRRDVARVDKSLNRSAWQPVVVLECMKTSKANRSWTERLADARRAGQRHIDRVPFHRLGVRTGGMALRDQLVGHGGLRILRGCLE